MYEIIEISPAEIRFMQDSIHQKFHRRGFVNDAIKQIENKTLRVDDFPKINVVKKDGFYYSLDNRRLYVFRVLNCRGLLNRVKVNLVPEYRFQSWKFTTRNNGESLYVRGGARTYTHYEEKPSLVKDKDQQCRADVARELMTGSYNRKNNIDDKRKIIDKKEKQLEKWKEILSNVCWHVVFRISDDDINLIAVQFNRIVCLHEASFLDEIDVLAMEFSQQLCLS